MPQVTGTIRAIEAVSRQRAYLGIDPGIQGGMTLIDFTGRPKGFYEFSSHSPHEVDYWIDGKLQVFEVMAAVEEVHSMPKQGIASTAKFMKAVGIVQGILIGNSIPFIEVSPQKWQKYFGIPPRKEKTITEHKKIIQSKAHQLFPAYVKEITREVADSVLLAEFLRQTEKK